MSQHRAVSITLDRVEGSHISSPRTVAGDNVWEQARVHLRGWSYTAPKDGSYHKTDFTVTFDDGQTYDGRFDLTYYDTDLVQHVKDHIAFCVSPPEGWDHIHVADWRTFQENYLIGDPA